MRSTTNLHRKLVKVDRGPLGAAGSWGIPHRISGDPSPRLYTSGGTGILRYAVLDLRRDSGTLAQRGYRGNPTGSTKLHIPNFPSTEKRWGLPSCYKPQEVEPLCQDRTLQDGGFTPSSISDPAGGLDGEAGFERCLLTGANPPRSASSPPVSMAKEILPVQVPSIRTFSSTLSVYQAAETSSGFPLPNGHSTDHIPRRYINPPSSPYPEFETSDSIDILVTGGKMRFPRTSLAATAHHMRSVLAS